MLYSGIDLHKRSLVIHTLGYQAGDRLRPVAHRLSFAEMVVPYRDPTNDLKARTAFDIGRLSSCVGRISVPAVDLTKGLHRRQARGARHGKCLFHHS